MTAALVALAVVVAWLVVAVLRLRAEVRTLTEHKPRARVPRR